MFDEQMFFTKKSEYVQQFIDLEGTNTIGFVCGCSNMC